VCTIRVGKMSYGLNKTLQMCTVEIASGLGYKSSQYKSESKSKSSSLTSKSESSKKSRLAYYKSALL